MIIFHFVMYIILNIGFELSKLITFTIKIVINFKPMIRLAICYGIVSNVSAENQSRIKIFLDTRSEHKETGSSQ